VAGLLRTGPAEVPARVAALLEERRKLERELADARRALATGGGGTGGTQVKDVGGIRFSPRLLDGVPAKDLKSLADDLKKGLGSGVVALVSSTDGKASLVVGVTEDLTERISAVDLVRVGSAALGGKGGGGRPDMAQAGGPDGSKAQAAVDAIEQALAGAA
jgi:alanyl-tRNA synthetase